MKVPSVISDLPIIVPVKTRRVLLGNASTRCDKAHGLVRVLSTVDCHLEFGLRPTATEKSMLLKADQPEYFSVLPGFGIAAIAARATAGFLYITQNG